MCAQIKTELQNQLIIHETQIIQINTQQQQQQQKKSQEQDEQPADQDTNFRNAAPVEQRIAQTWEIKKNVYIYIYI